MINYIYSLVAGLGILIGGWIMAKQSGRKAERQDQKDATLKNLEKINDADQELAKMADEDIRSELSKWVRDKDR